jgi:DnaJ-domain-containing protein 1
LNGQFPANEVLSVLANCDDNWDDIPTNVKEAFEELLWGSCTLRDITYGDAVRLIRQRGRIGERAQQRAARVELPGGDPDRPLAEPEAFALLGVAAGCTSEELAHAYHLTMSQWHPDKLENMATELKDYATRQTQRINEAYQKLKPMAAHRVRGE